MTTPDRFTAGVDMLVQEAHRLRERFGHDELTLHHWLVALVRRYSSMVLTHVPTVDPARVQTEILKGFAAGDRGPVLDEDAARAMAAAHADRIGVERVGEPMFVVSLFEAYGKAPSTPRSDPIEYADGPGQGRPTMPPRGSGPPPRPFVKARPTPTPTLTRFGRDLTEEARDGRFATILGRDAEVDTLIETLCRTTKRNPLLIGPAGVGKTAIVEALAHRIAHDDVPRPLFAARLVAVQPSVLNSGARAQGDIEERVTKLLDEAARSGALLFMDELHTVVGTGGMAGTGDIANLIKPSLARGEIACIGATTLEEFRRFIEPDAALERRFNPVHVGELSRDATRTILERLAARHAETRHVTIAPEQLDRVVDFAEQYMRNRKLPDKAVDLLDQCVAYAVTRGVDTLDDESIHDVLERMVGKPADPERRLESLDRTLQQQRLLADADRERLVARLAVSGRNLDLRSERPDALVLLTGAAASQLSRIGESIAASLFGDPGRVVRIDLGRFVESHSISELFGSPPGYVGHGQRLDIHRIAETPWCVVELPNIDRCHSSVRAAVLAGLETGHWTDSQGRRIHLSDAVVLVGDARIRPEATASRPLGFERLPEKAEPRDEGLLDVFDLVVHQIHEQPGAGSDWIRRVLLPELATSYASQGLTLEWEPAIVDWLADVGHAFDSTTDWDRWADQALHPRLLACVDDAACHSVRLQIEDGHLVVRGLDQQSTED